MTTIEKNRKAGIDEIAEAIGSPKHYTGKVLQILSRKKIVSSQKGPSGGFYLNQTQKKNNLLKVLSAFDDDRILGDCILGLKECSSTKPCPVHHEYEDIRDKLNILFLNTLIEDLSEELISQNVFLKS